MISAFPSSMLADKRLWQFLAKLTRGEPVPTNSDSAPPWFEPGVICEIPMATYFDTLELCRPGWQCGSLFLSGEETGPARLFWRQDDLFFGRELTAKESRTFAELIQADNTARSPLAWYTHLGVCPACQKAQDEAAEQKRFRQAYIEQQRRLNCPGCGEEPFVG